MTEKFNPKIHEFQCESCMLGFKNTWNTQPAYRNKKELCAECRREYDNTQKILKGGFN